MAWFVLFIAGLFEVGWAIGLKYSDGFSKLWPTVWTITAMIASFGLLGVSLRSLPVGTAYGVWVGIGIVGTVLFGVLMLDEPASPSRVFFVLLIIVGVIGLKLTATA
ncbi:Quaternary ammonium compound-resistance protein SugE [Rubripirellula lacrimiformis]|uniref:Guanidinium exporter n=1 Tax=Rubripirellula lacrimiformis TaxID=1930273 RepID=A0A517NED1_9BACT|nr:quaternary ammonium compound efflux SMR transporter SugE [Rubripirellula lacrimiformis]QDT05481.1 Quaternary ammonium compound-resistance protein SugE [Rubripirellula lacrimiformis]